MMCMCFRTYVGDLHVCLHVLAGVCARIYVLLHVCVRYVICMCLLHTCDLPNMCYRCVMHVLLQISYMHVFSHTCDLHVFSQVLGDLHVLLHALASVCARIYVFRRFAGVFAFVLHVLAWVGGLLLLLGGVAGLWWT